MTIYDFKVKQMNGQEISLQDFKGQILLIVNVASECGFTPQYSGLEALYRKYKDKGFSVLGFPCNQFGSQEPGNEEEIRSFCEKKYQITFPLFEKILVNGPNAHPLYQFLKKQEKGILGTEFIKWNFTKFLIGRDGTILQRFAPQVTPESLEKDIRIFH